MTLNDRETSGCSPLIMAYAVLAAEFHGREKPRVMSHRPCFSSNSTSSRPTLRIPSSFKTLTSHTFAFPTAVPTSTVLSTDYCQEVFRIISGLSVSGTQRIPKQSLWSRRLAARDGLDLAPAGLGDGEGAGAGFA